MWFDKLRFLEQLPAEVIDRQQDEQRVVDEEITYEPSSRKEDGVAVGEDHNGHPGETDVGAVGLTPAFVGESVAVETLSDAGSVEEDVGS